MRYVGMILRAVSVLPALFALLLLALVSWIARGIGTLGDKGGALADRHGEPLTDWIEGASEGYPMT